MTSMTIDTDVQAGDRPRGSGLKDHLICRLEGELREMTAIGTCRDGLRFVDEFNATVVAGLLAGGRVHGLEQFTLRPDGAIAITAPETITTGDTQVSLDIRGNIVAPAGSDLPSPAAIAGPGFDFPDLDLRLAGSALVRTSGPAYAHLDQTVVSIDGWVNFESGELAVEAWAT